MSAFPRYVHFVGIGGAGMAPLAELLKLRFPELVISGSDLLLNDKTRQLEKLGIRVFAGHRADQLPLETGLVIYS